MSGDVTIDNTGATTIGAGKVLSSMLADSLSDTQVTFADADDGTRTMNLALNTDQGSGSNIVLTAPAATGTIATLSNINDSLQLADGNIWIGDATGERSAQTMSGDVTIDNTGATTIGAGKVLGTMLEDSLAVNEFLFLDNTDSDGAVQFDLGAIDASTTRTLVMPNADDTLATLSNINDSLQLEDGKI